MKFTALFCALIEVTFLVSCKPATHTNVPSPSQQLASESAAAYNAKEFAKAQTLAAQATSTDPQFAEAWVAYGMASVRLGQTDLARQAYERALALHQARHRQNPSDANQVVQQIFLLILLGKPAEAETLLKQARAAYPNDQTIAKLAGDSAALSQGGRSIAVERK